MTRCGAWIGRSVVAAAAAWWLVAGGPARGQDNDVWDTAASGVWETGSSWADNSTPGILDRATFNLAGAYTVSFNAEPNAIRELTLTGAANVTFSSIPGHTLRVNSTLFGGPQDVNITNGARFTLGRFQFTPRPLHLTVGHELSVGSGSTLNVTNGSDVVTPALASDGQVNVTGSGSTLTTTRASMIAPGLSISGGSLNVTGGGVVQTNTAAIDFVGMGTVSGAGSQWIDTGTITVGQSTEGTLNVTGGGKIQSLSGSVGRSFNGVGVVTVSGAGSQWNNSSELSVGSGQGSGTLNVTGGGSVSSSDGFLGKSNFGHGTATITGGAWTMTGRLSVGGDVEGVGTLNIQPAGIVSAAQGVVIFPDSHVNLQGGTLDASSISYHEGIQGSQFQWTSGTLHVGTFNGSLTNSGGALAPGHSAGSTTINGNYTQFTGGDLEIEIGGPLAGSEFDFVTVNGSAQINGELDLTLTGGFVPTPSQTFTILIAGNLSGTFDNAASGQRVTTTDGGGSFLVNYGVDSPFDDNQIILSAFQPAGAFTADFDNDGDVDSGDLAQWRGDFGVNALSNADGDGDSDGADFLAWQRQLGSGPPVSVSANAPVPEPATFLLFIAAMAGIRLRAGQMRQELVSE